MSLIEDGKLSPEAPKNAMLELSPPKAESPVPFPSEFEEDLNPVIESPPVPEPFSGLQDGIACFGFSQQGSSHIASNTPCQDRCYSVYLNEGGTLIAAIADGVGSCALSDLGADAAVHASVNLIRDELRERRSVKLDAKLAGTLLRKAFQFAFDEVVRTADKFEQLLYSFQSTLTVAIYDGTNLYFGHAGDDGIVALTEDRTLALATARHSGQEASSVYPLQSRNTWQFGMVPRTAAFVMATDGVLDAFVRSAYEKSRVYYPFLKPIFTAPYQTGSCVERLCATLYEYMKGDAYRSAVHDDLTIVAVMNTKTLPTSLPDFDLDVWNRESQQYQEAVQNALYKNPQEPEPAAPDKPAAAANTSPAEVPVALERPESVCAPGPVFPPSEGKPDDSLSSKQKSAYSDEYPVSNLSNCRDRKRNAPQQQRNTTDDPTAVPDGSNRKFKRNGLGVDLINLFRDSQEPRKLQPLDLVVWATILMPLLWFSYIVIQIVIQISRLLGFVF